MTADEQFTSSRSPGDGQAVEPAHAQPHDRSNRDAWDATRSSVDAYDASILARHAELVAVDNVIGLEATVARLEYELRMSRNRVKRLRNRLEDAHDELQALRSSRTWKVGRMLTRPLGRLRG